MQVPALPVCDMLSVHIGTLSSATCEISISAMEEGTA